MAALFGVKLPQTTKYKLKDKLRNLEKDSKTTLFFLYSEFLLRANRNPWYKYVLNKADLSAIDGKGLHFAMWINLKNNLFPKLYGNYFIYLPYFLRMPIFGILFALELLHNMLFGFLTLLTKFNYTKITKNEVILGRDFVYDLLHLSVEKKWKTLVLGGNKDSDEITKNLITKLFEGVDLITWNRESKSLLMRDQVDQKFKDEDLTIKNIYQLFPDLWEAREFIRINKPDLILTCLGGASGKQEIFIQALKEDPQINFTLATGLGAAVDHLGGGTKQPKPPKAFEVLGLEWLYRFITTPKRRKRIVDSIITLWLWMTLEEFIKRGQERRTVINICFRKTNDFNKEFLLVKRPNVLAGDIGWSFVQGGIEPKEGIFKAGKREMKEEVGIDSKNLLESKPSISGILSHHTISLTRFLLQGAVYNRSQHYLCFLEYVGEGDEIKINWENLEYKWVKKEEVISYLSIEKQGDYIKARDYI